MSGVTRDRTYRPTGNRLVRSGLANPAILEPLASLANADRRSGCSGSGAILQNVPDLPQRRGDAGQGSDMGDAEQPACDLLPG